MPIDCERVASSLFVAGRSKAMRAGLSMVKLAGLETGWLSLKTI